MRKSLRYSPVEDAIEHGALLSLYYGGTRHDVTDFEEAWRYMCWVDGDDHSNRASALEKVLRVERDRVEAMGLELPLIVNPPGFAPLRTGLMFATWK